MRDCLTAIGLANTSVPSHMNLKWFAMTWPADWVPGPYSSIKRCRLTSVGNILRPSYLHNGISYTSKTTSLCRTSAQDCDPSMYENKKGRIEMDWSVTFKEKFAVRLLVVTFRQLNDMLCLTLYVSQSSWLASLSPAGLTLWLERWLATLGKLSTQGWGLLNQFPPFR